MGLKQSFHWVYGSRPFFPASKRCHRRVFPLGWSLNSPYAGKTHPTFHDKTPYYKRHIPLRNGVDEFIIPYNLFNIMETMRVWARWHT